MVQKVWPIIYIFIKNLQENTVEPARKHGKKNKNPNESREKTNEYLSSHVCEVLIQYVKTSSMRSPQVIKMNE